MTKPALGRRLGIAHLTALDLPPPEFIELVAEAGFDDVGLRLIAINSTTPGYPLMDDAALMRQTRQAIANSGVTVNDIEFVRVTPELDVGALEPFFRAGAELGAKYVIVASFDPELSRLAENLGKLGEAARTYDLTPVLEFFPWTNVPDLAAAIGVVSEVETAKPGILLDTLHFNRSQSRLDDIATVLPDWADWFPFIHLSDAEVQNSYTEEQLLHTARAERLIPGTGAIPLREILSAFPPDHPVSVEIPSQKLAREIGYRKLLQRIHDQTRQFLEKSGEAS